MQNKSRQLLVLEYSFFFRIQAFDTTPNKTGERELARSSGGGGQGPPILKKKSERVKIFEVLIFLIFFKIQAFDTTQKQTWGRELARSSGGGGHGPIILKRVKKIEVLIFSGFKHGNHLKINLVGEVARMSEGRWSRASTI